MAREGSGQLDREMRTFAGTAVDEYGSGMLLDYSVGEREPQTRTLTDFLGREERVVDARNVLRCYSDSSIAQFNYRGSIYHPRLDRESPAPVHRVARIQDQVHEDLL